MIAAHELALPGTAACGPSRIPLLATIRRWEARHRYRTDLRRLLQLGAYLLEDAGIEVGHAILEVDKPFWRA